MSRKRDGERPAASPDRHDKPSRTDKAGRTRQPAPSDFDPLTHLHVTEDASESAWRRFEALLKGEAADFDATESALHVPRNSAGWHPTAAGTLPGALERLTLHAELDDVLALARKANRSSPAREAWDDLYHLLPATEHGARQFAPPPPLPIDQSTPMQRRLRLRDQIEWAEVAGVLPLVHAFLARLADGEWTYFDRGGLGPALAQSGSSGFPPARE
jgi:hypothetical protein